MVRHLEIAIGMALVGVMIASAVTAQAQTAGSRPDAGAGIARAYEVEGTVARVDPSSGIVKVSTGFFGLLGRTLWVTVGTQIQVEGRQATLADIKPGAKVKAAYEERDGRNVAMRIDQAPAGEPGKTPQ